jgi:phytoene dehydrogenase-like protein
MKAIIIGSGLAGLTSAALLARESHEVTVFEQYENIGGVTSTIEKDGFRWDWGQMLVPDLSEGEAGRLLLEKLDISERIRTIKSYRENYFPDFRISRPREYLGTYWRRESFKTLFPEDSNGLDKYYKIYDRIHDIVALAKKKGFMAKLKLLLTFLPLMRKKQWSAQALMNYCFSNRKLQAVYTAILADYVASPEIFPGLIIPTINAENQYDERVPLKYGSHEHRSSWSYVIGGMIEIVNALAFSVDQGKITSVTTSKGEKVDADIIIASGGAKELYIDLIDVENVPEEFIKTYISNVFTTESVFMIHLGVNCEDGYDPASYQNGAALCYYYFTYDIDDSIKQCQNGIYHEGTDGLLIYIPSVHSPNMAPPNHHAITIYTIAPNYPTNGSWSADKARWAEKLLNLAEKFMPGLKKHEVTRIILTPEDFRKRTHLKKHAFGGTVPHLKIPPPPHQSPIKGLWFVGAQSETYGGVVGALTGAENVVDAILKEAGTTHANAQSLAQTFKKLSK